ncbi:MAG: DUF3467 domain-containing protein [Candidatus Cloacimonadota bacterium]|nr:MAG: DUF3467 domain-containing protein [Candidatus Cloacimonadota bacterium]
MEKPAQQINIEIGDAAVEGTYSNFAFITHSPAEFIIDFARILPGMKKAKVHSRIIMTPQHAKMLFNALENNIKKFQDRFGEIKNVTEPGKEIGFRKPE